MDSVVEKLSEIETTAEAIVEQAESKKAEIEKEIQAKRDQFDQELEEETQKKLGEIRLHLSEKMERILDEQRIQNNEVIEALKKDFEENHTLYAKEILRRIIEV